MIRKPTEKDFRESKAVTALRETKRVSVEGSKGIGKGLANAYLYFFGAMMAFGFVASMIEFSARGGGGVVLGLVAMVMIFVAVFKADRRKTDGLPVPLAAPVPRSAAANVAQQGTLRLDRAKLISKAGMLAIPAVLMFVWGGFGALRGPIMGAGIVMFALAALLAHRAFGDNKVLEYDHRSVKVVGLLGGGDLLWADVDDIYVRTFSRLNVRVIFSSGSRKNLVISAARNRMEGPSQLLVPIDLLELDKEGLVQLVTDLLCCRAAGGEIVPSWQRQETAAAPSPEYLPGPASDPRESFDPDAIMARYLAEREKLVADVRPDLQATVPATARKTFGRKVN